MGAHRPSILSVVALVGCATQPAAPEPSGSEPPAVERPSVHEVMQEHFVYVDDLQKAVIAGDLGQAKSSAQWIMDHHIEHPNKAWLPHLKLLEQAAQHVTAAPDLAQASIGAARVAGACGSCHAAHGIDLELSAPPIQEGKGTKNHMKRHQWATNRLWDGVVGNSDAVWKEGSAALLDDPLKIHNGSPATDDDVLLILTAAAEVVHDIGKRSLEIDEPKDRVKALGELLSTCAACHGQLGIQPYAK